LFLKKPSLQLKSRRKWSGGIDGNGSVGNGDILMSRIKSPKETLKKIIPICNKIGVTRIADITYMDRLYIPSYSPVLPGTKDSIWVYNGKGPTKVHAKASALMETIERFSALAQNTAKRKFISGSYADLAKKYKVLHPDETVEALRFEYKNDMVMDFLPGTDLFTNEQILVPSALASYHYVPKAPAINPFTYTHTTGLASGNVIEEAICHALCEVIERDAISIADLCTSAIPYTILERITNSLKQGGYHNLPSIDSVGKNKFIDDSSIFPDVDLTEIEFEPIKILAKKFACANLPLLIKYITQEDIGIPTFVASSIEWINPYFGYFALGYGTHPDARIALIRAITEVSQSRVVNIQGARDDLKNKKFNYIDETWYKRKWKFIESKERMKISEIKTYSNPDILDDIKLLLNRLKHAGLKRVIIVDLTNPDIGIPVVRAIVPGLETFEISESVMGRRAKEYFKKKILRKE
jgi:thioglycine synthase